MKGIILAGGTGSRLFPATLACSKQLLTIYDKPMIYYPLSILMLAGIRDILIISTPKDLPAFERLLGDGAQLGINISYKEQKEPRGLAESFIIGEEFIGNDNVCLILGDNLFYGNSLSASLQRAAKLEKGAVLYLYHVDNPSDYGVATLSNDGKVVEIEEKPKNPKSNFAVTGLYFYDNQVIDVAKNVKPSKRGELEITDVNNYYIRQGTARAEFLNRGNAWLDTGTHKTMLEASMFIQAIQSRQGLYIACIEEIAYRQGFIDKESLIKLGEKQKASDYGKYILRIAGENYENTHYRK
jgi:glucose-1-phosphate thymidylyltransferase